ncbi:MAG: response regulator [Armatimonadetes bacterium]|nr:response regulator [Armatimonadota bacterium]
METPKLMIVDDEEVVRDNVRWVMERQGWHVAEAASETQAREMVQADHFDVIVVDMKMDRDESGIEILQLSKQHSPSTEIVILTAYGNLQNAAKAMELGAYTYVEKNTPDVDVYQLLLLKVRQALERKRLHAENRRLQATLIEAERRAALGILSSAIAHEVNNPLTGILGYTQFALESASPGSQISHDLKLIEENTLRCQKILRNILDFARPDDGEAMPLDLHDAIERVLSLVEREAMRNKITVSRNYCVPQPYVVATPNQVSQVFMNLMINAIQAMPDGGEVEIRSLLRDDTVQVCIRDTGPGIPSENLPHIFDMFFSTKDQGKGTGLGLYICRDIALGLKGNIQVDSVLEHGTTFTVSLPVMGG